MASINKVILIGNAGRDPESRNFANGDMVTNVSIATTETWKDKNTGEKKEATEWHRLSFGGGLAKVAAEYIKKGSSIYVEGSIKTRKWNDAESGQEKSMVEIRVDTLKLLGGRPDGAGQQGGGGGGQQRQQAPQQRQQAPARQQKPAQGFDDMDDGIPF